MVDQASAEATEIAGKCLTTIREKVAISTLRGQHVDSGDWREDPSRPATIVGTVDMIGSRLLFEGYGVSRRMRPMHAGLLGADTLIVLDEAHLVPPFRALVEAVSTDPSLAGAEARPVPRLQFMALSATQQSLANAPTPFGLDEDDRRHPEVARRLGAVKRLSVHPVEALEATGTCEETGEESVFRKLRDEVVLWRAARLTAEALVWHHGVEGVYSADHITGDHMRHGARLLRWRTDKLPESCTMAQIR